MRLRLTTLWLILGSLMLGGCWSHHPAQRRSGSAGAPELTFALPTPDAWPARDLAFARDLLERTREVRSVPIEPQSVDDGPRRLARMPSNRLNITFQDTIGMGLVREVQPVTEIRVRGLAGTAPDSETLMTATQESPRFNFVTSRSLASPITRFNRELRLAAINRTNQLRVDAGVAPLPGSAYIDACLDLGPVITLPPQPEQPARGLIIHMQSLGANVFEPRVIETLRDRGWVVITVPTQWSIVPPMDSEAVASLDRLKERAIAEIDALPTAEALRTALDATTSRAPGPARARLDSIERDANALLRRGFQLCDPADLDTVARQIASEIDTTAAGNAYVVEALLEYLRVRRPDLPQRPLVVLGMSAGALASPAVVARVRDRVDAMVLIGGGANLFRISQTSTLTDGGLRVRCGDKPVPAGVLRDLDAHCRGLVRLDPYKLAPALVDVPTLQIDASIDTWVPTAAAELLHERLGRPERWTVSGGHRVLFASLPGIADRLGVWLERAVPAIPQEHSDPAPTSEAPRSAPPS